MRENEGFSLIELIIAVAIVALLAAIAIPIFRNQQMKAKESTVRQDIRALNAAMLGIRAQQTTPTTPYVGGSLHAALNATFKYTKGNGYVLVYNCGYSGSGGSVQSAPGEYIVTGVTTGTAGSWTQQSGSAKWVYVSQNDTWYGPGAAPMDTMLNSQNGVGSAGQECGNSGYSGGIYLTPQ